ncbi:MAG: phosphoesterase [Actinoallomurus sp.]|nr:phosphoesterase [Actinoallomurus sp.]
MLPESVDRWIHARFSAEGRLGLRMTLACSAVLIVAVPFAGLLALVDTRWAPLRHLDDVTTRSIHSYLQHHRVLVPPLRATSYIFHPWVFRVLVAGLAVWLFYRGARRLAAWAVTNLVASGILEGGLKALVNRPRPALSSPIAHAPGGSFPSGHALTAVVGSATIVLILLPVLRGAWRAVAWAAATVVSVLLGACRVALGVHYVSDVVAGWILGAAIVLATTAAFETWRRDEGRRPVAPIRQGTQPEAAPRISGSGGSDPARSA